VISYFRTQEYLLNLQKRCGHEGFMNDFSVWKAIKENLAERLEAPRIIFLKETP
jgi:hypothetical protein